MFARLLHYFGAVLSPSRNTKRVQRPSCRFRPFLERLERRAVPAVYTVNSVLDFQDASVASNGMADGVAGDGRGSCEAFPSSIAARREQFRSTFTTSP
jgi:hypothetical protein